MNRGAKFLAGLISLLASVTVFFSAWLWEVVENSILQYLLIAFLVPILVAMTLSLIAGYFFISLGPEEKYPFASTAIRGAVVFFLGASLFAFLGVVTYCQNPDCGPELWFAVVGWLVIIWPLVWLASPLIGIIIALGMKAGWRLKKRKGGIEEVKEAPADEPPAG